MESTSFHPSKPSLTLWKFQTATSNTSEKVGSGRNTIGTQTGELGGQDARTTIAVAETSRHINVRKDTLLKFATGDGS